jgi:hypothetical protein
MSKLDFLEISRYFKGYYRTLRDVHYYLTNDSEVSPEELQAVSKVLSKLIYGFIRVNGKAFREMDSEQYDQQFHLFHQDFLSVIQNSGENNVDFDQFTSLIDEILEIAVMRINALGKIRRGNQEQVPENNEMTEAADDKTESSNEHETDADDDEEVIVDEVKEADEEEKIVEEEAVTLVENVNALVISVSPGVDETLPEPEIIQEVKPALDVTFDVEAAESAEPVEEVKVQTDFVDAGPITNNFNDYESSDHFRFRPRRRKNR